MHRDWSENLTRTFAGWRRFSPASIFRPEPAPGCGTRAPRRTILIVDDESDARECLRLSLLGEGFEVIEAASGIEALMLVAHRLPDLAIIDVMMAGMSGFELCDALRSWPDTRHVPIILCSAHEVKPHSNTGRYDHALVKPVDLPDLIGSIERLLPGRH